MSAAEAKRMLIFKKNTDAGHPKVRHTGFSGVPFYLAYENSFREENTNKKEFFANKFKFSQIKTGIFRG